MYRLVLASDDDVFRKLAVRFVRAIDPTFDIVALPFDDALDACPPGTPADVIALDADDPLVLTGFIDAMDRRRVESPLILVSSDPDPSLMGEAINRDVG